MQSLDRPYGSSWKRYATFSWLQVLTTSYLVRVCIFGSTQGVPHLPHLMPPMPYSPPHTISMNASAPVVLAPKSSISRWRREGVVVCACGYATMPLCVSGACGWPRGVVYLPS